MIHYKKIDHIQICIPHAEIKNAESFYCEKLNFHKMEIPKAFEGRELLWVSSGEIEIHIGTEKPSPKSSRHPAFEVEDLKQAKEHITSQGIEIKNSTPLPGRERFSIIDPWGNKLEFLEYQ